MPAQLPAPAQQWPVGRALTKVLQTQRGAGLEEQDWTVCRADSGHWGTAGTEDSGDARSQLDKDWVGGQTALTCGDR